MVFLLLYIYFNKMSRVNLNCKLDHKIKALDCVFASFRSINATRNFQILQHEYVNQRC